MTEADRKFIADDDEEDDGDDQSSKKLSKKERKEKRRERKRLRGIHRDFWSHYRDSSIDYPHL